MSPVWAGVVNPGSPVSKYIGTQSSCHTDPAVSMPMCSLIFRQPSTRGPGNPASIRVYPCGRCSSRHFVGGVETLVKLGPGLPFRPDHSGTTPIHCSPHPWATRLLNIMKWQFVSRPLRSSPFRGFQPITLIKIMLNGDQRLENQQNLRLIESVHCYVLATGRMKWP